VVPKCVSSFATTQRAIISRLTLRLLAFLLLVSFPRITEADPSNPNPVFKQQGYWTTKYDWKVRAIHLALLRGRDTHSQILWWNRGPGPVTNDGRARLWQWDPGDTLSTMTEMMSVVDVPTGTGEDIFCSGHSALPDGRLLVTGGTEAPLTGLDLVKIYNPAAIPSAAWSTVESMGHGRWYPTNTTLKDGSVLVTSGRLGLEMVSFGGVDDPTFIPNTSNTVLALRGNFADYSVTMGGSIPTAREGHTSIFDATVSTDAQNGDINFRINQRTLIFGGRRSDVVVSNDLWELRRDELSTWTWNQLSLNGAPPARRDHSAIYAYASTPKAMIVFGGRDGSDFSMADVYKLTLRTTFAGTDTWSLLSPGGGPVPSRYGHTAVFDTIGATMPVMLVFGGMSTATTFSSNDVWQLSLNPGENWSILPTTGVAPTPRENHAAAFDLRGNRMILFGGRTSLGPSNQLFALTYVSGGWVWSNLGATVLPDDQFGFPTARFGHSMIYDPEFQRLVIFGGDTTYETPGGVLGDVWFLPLYESPLKWRRDRSGLTLSARTGHTAVLDSRYVNAIVPEIYSASGMAGWTPVTLATKWQNLYPNSFLLPNGKIFYAAPTKRSMLLNPQTWLWEPVSSWISSTSPGGSAAMYLPGKIMKCGEEIEGEGSTFTAKIDLNGTMPNSWTNVTSLPLMLKRTKHNLTILPTGEVLVTGGMENANNLATAVRVPQVWDPRPAADGGEVWKANILAPDPVIRDYHSSALLLPDGRVLSAGGELQSSTDAKMATIYYPTYLFDQTGTYIHPDHPQRPTISCVDTLLALGQDVDVYTPNASAIFKVCLIRPGAVTHQFNQEQLFIPLTFSNLGARLRARIPASADSVPPGNYMMFIVKTDSLPSVASWVRVAPKVAHSGSLTADETWTPQNGPHVVSGDLTVPSNRTLTIQAGTKITCAGPAARIVVNGILVINGTTNNKVRLGPTLCSTASGDWWGIQVGSQGAVTVHFAEIEYAQYGIKGEASAGAILIDQCDIRNSQVAAIDVSGTGTSSTSLTVTGGTIVVGSSPYGIRCDGGYQVMIDGTVVTGTSAATYGIWVSSLGIGANPQAAIKNVTISGLTAGTGVYVAGNSPSLNNCQVSNCKWGIQLRGTGNSPRIEPLPLGQVGATITGSTTGLYVEATNPLVNKVTITSPGGGTGVSNFGNSGGTYTYVTVSGGAVGFAATATDTTGRFRHGSVTGFTTNGFKYNDPPGLNLGTDADGGLNSIHSTGAMGKWILVKTCPSGGPVVKARQNYWGGTPDPSKFSSCVDYGNWLTSAPSRPLAEPSVAIEETPVEWTAGPNPFSQGLILTFHVDSLNRGRISAALRVFDISGCLVRTVSLGVLDSGNHQVEWDGRD
jgi:hypothetical protein